MAKAMPRSASAVQMAGVPELGRVRMGAKAGKAYKDRHGKERRAPVALESWRLTSPSRERLQAAVDLSWGDEVKQWQSPRGPEWELFTTKPDLDVLVPPFSSLSWYYERWDTSGCLQTRCDGDTILSAADESRVAKTCICTRDASLSDDERCDLTTRLNVIIPDLPGFGVWRFETLGYYSNQELEFVVPILSGLSDEKLFVKCQLSIVARTSRDKSTGQVKRFKIGTLQPKNASVPELMSGMVRDEALALPRPTKPTPQQITQAMSDLGYGDDGLQVVHHRALPEHSEVPEEKYTDNPYAPGGERDEAILDMAQMCANLKSHFNDPQPVNALLMATFKGKVHSPDDLKVIAAEHRLQAKNLLGHLAGKLMQEDWPKDLDEWVQNEKRNLLASEGLKEETPTGAGAIHD